MSGSILTFGTQWLEQLPDDWSQMRARYLFRERKQKSSPDDTHLTPSQKYAVLPQSEYMKLTGNRVVLNLTGSDNMKHVESGDFVIHLRSFQGGIEYSQYTGKVSNAYTVLQPKETVVPDFFRHVLKSYGFISELSKTTDQLRDGQSIKFSQLDLLEFPLPSPEIQQKIADFLDTETGQIDNLIAKQERLLELLEEKRRATITHAVTRGLNPSVELRETSHPWMPAINSSWSVTPMKTLLNKTKNAIKTGPFGSDIKNSDYVDDDSRYARVYTQANIISRNLGKQKVYITKEKYQSLASCKIDEGDIVMTTRGTLGKSLIFPRGAELGILHPCLLRVQLDERKVMPEFFQLITNDVGYFIDQLKYASNSTTIDVLYGSNLRGMKIVLPGVDEQKEILSRLEQIQGRYDSLRQKIQTQITLLRERRTSLISHAVTGKVKV